MLHSPYGQIDFITTAGIPILLATANNSVNGDKVVQQQIGKLGEAAEPYVLDSTPDVLSIGRRCVEEGYSFEWLPILVTAQNYAPRRPSCEVDFERLLSLPRRILT